MLLISTKDLRALKAEYEAKTKEYKIVYKVEVDLWIKCKDMDSQIQYQ